MPLKIAFMGTPDFSVPTLVEILGQGHEIAAVYTRAPRPAGRGMDERKSPVHEKAEAFGIPVRTPKTLRDADEQARFAELGVDAAVVVAYGLILPAPVLEAPAHGCLNLHASLLPRWRGAAPINRAIMAGDEATGVMVMRMEEGLDTGPVCMSEEVAITREMTAGQLHDRLARLGGDLMVRALAALERDALSCTPQSGDGVTYAKKIDKAETRIHWTRTADELHDHVRGLSPFPGAWCEMARGGKTERIKVLRTEPAEGTGVPGTLLDDALTIACGDGAIRLLEVQRAGKAAMSAEAFLRGAGLTVGSVLR
ncbi:methionyl-tRNA formyltransferase [Rhodobium orientis]|uniref:Methionyl-tRNA formyltransferase n=1 Tax=Rhodobium orientis TaxID=34017 RepID=A0A327JMS7_9HYPH|nr:methionyl-tRNA formyltransferase [Rhodobium orientis]MBB4304664.1 methionyl-tRNA formyltransferase [Rhodobium orientis]MBK5950039.1 methionyl-tRNA formyltransferase [Rhodobium orientis]RAI27729.1 methionyl-tRNA formyltransferase [Rhodobium orientis]